MRDIFLTFLVGLLLGATCGYFRLPIPAPPTLAGVMGIAGVFIGFVLLQRLTR